MAKGRPVRKNPQQSGARFTEEEKAAMREHAREQRPRSRPRPEDGEREVVEKIATMSPADRALAERLHALIRAAAPTLVPRTWYGMPAYAREEKVICFFQDAGKFKTRYATLGFSHWAKLDEGRMWPTSFAVTELTPAEESRITELVKRAAA